MPLPPPTLQQALQAYDNRDLATLRRLTMSQCIEVAIQRGIKPIPTRETLEGLALEGVDWRSIDNPTPPEGAIMLDVSDCFDYGENSFNRLLGGLGINQGADHQNISARQ